MASEPRTLRRLGEALLNATLMLAAIVLFLAVVLVWQVRGLASDVRTGLRTELTTVQPRVAQARATAREALSALEASRQSQPDGTPPPDLIQAQDRLRALIDELDLLDPAPGSRERTETLLQRLVLAIIATAAQGLLPPSAP